MRQNQTIIIKSNIIVTWRNKYIRLDLLCFHPKTVLVNNKIVIYKGFVFQGLAVVLMHFSSIYLTPTL